MPIKTEIPTATNPTVRETQEPWSMRAKTSLPRSSVPRMYMPSLGISASRMASRFGLERGGRSFSSNLTVDGSMIGRGPIVRRSPVKATRKNKTKMAIPKTASLLDLSCSQNSWDRDLLGARSNSSVSLFQFLTSMPEFISLSWDRQSCRGHRR